VIRPGDGAAYEHFLDNPQDAARCGYVPPYDFNSREGIPCPPQDSGCCGIRIDRDQYPGKDYIQANAAEASRAIPKIPVPRIALNNHGDMNDWCKSGMGRNLIFSNTFGKMPMYNCRVKNILAMEDYRLRCNLLHNGRVGGQPHLNMMNQLGLLDLINTKNPAIWESPLFIKPKPHNHDCGQSQGPQARLIPY